MTHPLKMNRDAVTTYLQDIFPQYGGEILEVEADHSLLRQPIEYRHLRPGDTVSGPTMMELADVALYVAILSRVGPLGMTVTTDFTCHFLSKPRADRALMARASLLKIGKRLVIGEAELYSEGESTLLAHVVATYALPPQG